MCLRPPPLLFFRLSEAIFWSTGRAKRSGEWKRALSPFVLEIFGLRPPGSGRVGGDKFESIRGSTLSRFLSFSREEGGGEWGEGKSYAPDICLDNDHLVKIGDARRRTDRFFRTASTTWVGKLREKFFPQTGRQTRFFSFSLRGVKGRIGDKGIPPGSFVYFPLGKRFPLKLGFDFKSASGVFFKGPFICLRERGGRRPVCVASLDARPSLTGIPKI